MQIETRYKLTDQDLRTHKGYQWTVGKWVKTSGEGPLCKAGWLHCYNDPLLAVLHNPVHANIVDPRLWRVEVRGRELRDGQVKCGWTEMRLVDELDLPTISDLQRTAYGIMCAMEIYHESGWVTWAKGWLDGTDRTSDSAAMAASAAWVARATYAARAACAAASAAWAARVASAARAAKDANPNIDLLAIARKAMEVAS